MSYGIEIEIVNEKISAIFTFTSFQGTHENNLETKVTAK
jgi:hypothetical protein